MKLDYIMDQKLDSFSFTHTPNLSSQKLPFIVHQFGQFNMGSKYFTDREGLDSYLLFYTLEGNGVLEYRGVKSIIGPNQAAFIHCEEHQLYYTGESGNWKFNWIHLSGTACSHYMNLINDNSISIIELSSLCETLKYIDIMYQVKSESNVLTDIKFSMFLTNIMTELIVKKFNSANSEFSHLHATMVEKVIKYIKEDYNKRITLESMSNLAELSKYHLLRLFKKYTGVPPYEYLINYRINRSKLLLKETNKTIYEISYEIGYNDANNYIRDFKKYVGTTPLKYRNNWIE